eukprot:867970-Amphidinium_carterae.1
MEIKTTCKQTLQTIIEDRKEYKQRHFRRSCNIMKQHSTHGQAIAEEEVKSRRTRNTTEETRRQHYELLQREDFQLPRSIIDSEDEEDTEDSRRPFYYSDTLGPKAQTNQVP